MDKLKARAGIIGLINALGFIAMGLGKVSQETLDLWVKAAGDIFDWGVLIFGTIALVTPSIKEAWAKLKESKA